MYGTRMSHKRFWGWVTVLHIRIVLISKILQSSVGARSHSNKLYIYTK